MTPEGQRALDLAQWAWADPRGRVQQALSEVSGMAATATGQALSEIQDAGTMLTRLAGTLEPETITQQLASETIIAQIIELGRSTAWMHEARSHGRFASSGEVAHAMLKQQSAHASQVRRIQALQARAHAPAVAQPKSLDSAASAVVDHMAPSKAEAVSAKAKAVAAGDWQKMAGQVAGGSTPVPKLADLMQVPPEKFGPVEAHQLVQAQYEQELHPQHAIHLPDILKRADQHIEKSLSDFRKEEHAAGTDEARNAARKKMLIEGSVAVAGAALAMIIGIFGAPLVAIVAATFGPILVQIGLERKWELAWPT
jgi:hypothetical protein